VSGRARRVLLELAQQPRRELEQAELRPALGGEPPEPAGGGALEARVAGAREQLGQRERVLERQSGQLARRRERDRDVPPRDGVLEGSVRRSGSAHEHMFAQPRAR